MGAQSSHHATNQGIFWRTHFQVRMRRITLSRQLGVRCFKQIWKVVKVGMVGKVAKVAKVVYR